MDQTSEAVGILVVAFSRTITTGKQKGRFHRCPQCQNTCNAPLQPQTPTAWRSRDASSSVLPIKRDFAQRLEETTSPTDPVQVALPQMTIERYLRIHSDPADALEAIAAYFGAPSASAEALCNENPKAYTRMDTA